LFEIYGKYNCKYCDEAKAMLEERGFGYTYFNIEGDRRPYLEEFKNKYPDKKTVPQIESPDGEYIGGATELREWLKHYTPKS
jgi:thioredoxin reductase (NADPH)